MKPVVRIDNLSKLYRIGTRRNGSYRTLRETVSEVAVAPWRRFRSWSRQWGAVAPPQNGEAPRDSIWALREVSFDVQPGEVVGIIGGNGAGKSTLLKVLSRITEPTHGRVEMRGRVASLLEVGTGFHPELTGRENVFLNGAILGMTRREISGKFDEIVAFAEIDQFIDTPVKRYSSGMYVRLAFAVAAHLEPEILIVDEVLAVGDATFQRKCLGKLQDVARCGRTVLFVSHNMGALRSLCTRIHILKTGRLISSGAPSEQVARYLASTSEPIPRHAILDRKDREGNGEMRIATIDCVDAAGDPIQTIVSGDTLRIDLGLVRPKPEARLRRVALSLFTYDGHKLFHLDNDMTGDSLDAQTVKCSCIIPRLGLVPGRYYFNAMLTGNGGVADHVSLAASIDVIDGDFFMTGRPAPANAATFFVSHRWE